MAIPSYISINKVCIKSIIKVVFEDDLLELYFNVERNKNEESFKLSIADGGETILFEQEKTFKSLKDITYEIYTSGYISKEEELGRLIGNSIKLARFGIGQTLDANDEVLYYFMIATNKNEFLFFNNGDKGAYTFDKLDLILDNDIYGYEWSKFPPSKI